MTIRRRLYKSNIMMIVLPVVISLLVVSIISTLLMAAFGISRNGHNETTMSFLLEAREEAADWAADASAGTVTRSLTEVVEEFPARGAALYVYRDGQQLYAAGRQIDETLSAAALAQGGEHTYTTNGGMVTVMQEGVYTLVGMWESPMLKKLMEEEHGWAATLLVLAALGTMACIILVVNLVLTRRIFKHIMEPLGILVDGVHQIAGGNLGYRIKYEGKDEFTPVIEDFNDMAVRLQDMVGARQRDDESRRELIAGISHDLRTPLTSIIGYVEGLEQGVASTPAMQARYLAIIRQQADTLSHTIGQLFMLTKLDTDSFPMHMEPVELGAELSAYRQGVVDAYADKGLAVDYVPPSGPLWVEADRVQLRNVLTNVLENSVKYGKKEGGRVEIRCWAEGPDAAIILTDNGPGVPTDRLEKLFAVFYRGDASRGNSKDGSGLGLAISARIVQRLGGRISAENAAEGGLVIRISLPLSHKEDVHAKDFDR